LIEIKFRAIITKDSVKLYVLSSNTTSLLLNIQFIKKSNLATRTLLVMILFIGTFRVPTYSLMNPFLW